MDRGVGLPSPAAQDRSEETLPLSPHENPPYDPYVEASLGQSASYAAGASAADVNDSDSNSPRLAAFPKSPRPLSQDGHRWGLWRGSLSSRVTSPVSATDRHTHSRPHSHRWELASPSEVVDGDANVDMPTATSSLVFAGLNIPQLLLHDGRSPVPTAEQDNLTIVPDANDQHLPQSEIVQARADVVNNDDQLISDEVDAAFQQRLEQYHHEDEDDEEGKWSRRSICSKILVYFPYFTVAQICIIWIFFVWGILSVSSWSAANVSLTSPVSPNIQTFWFITVNFWPSCTSAKGNTWRLVSYQFTHDGLTHIIGNSLWLLYYGSLLDATHPMGGLMTWAAYEVSVVVGALTFSLVWPYQGLVGASAGIYGIIGCMIAHVVVNKDKVHPFLHLVMCFTLIVELLGDLISYFVAYSPTVGYAAHFGGFFSGLLLGFMFAPIHTRKIWKRSLAAVSGVIFVILLSLLLVNFISVWPPAPPRTNPTFHPYDPGSCCGELYQVVNDQCSWEQAKNSYACPNQHIVYQLQTYPPKKGTYCEPDPTLLNEIQSQWTRKLLR